MTDILRYPIVFSMLCFVVLWLSAQGGQYLRKRQGELDEGERADLGIILTAVLTLLGLIIGFTFSMAVSRYDQRKNYEAAEANVIGTEYLRAGLLPAADAARVRGLLKRCLDQRVLFYTTRDARLLEQIKVTTAQLQTDLWAAVQAPALAQPTPIVALAVSGMNDVLDSQGYAQAADWNRIPIPAWGLMGAIAILSSILIGLYARYKTGKITKVFILPLIVSIAFFLIADLDSPRGGIIRVSPENLASLILSP